MLARKSGFIASSVAVALALGVAVIHARDSGGNHEPVVDVSVPDIAHMQQVTATMEKRTYLTPGLTRSEFEHELREHFIGTYRLYQALNEQARGDVYIHYQTNNTIATLRRMVAYSL